MKNYRIFADVELTRYLNIEAESMEKAKEFAAGIFNGNNPEYGCGDFEYLDNDEWSLDRVCELDEKGELIDDRKELWQMVSKHCYEEIISKVKGYVGEKAFKYIFPAVTKALESGDREVREHILIGWLNMDSCRVCTECGKITEEGWYLDCHGYACSDECCKKAMGISNEEFERYSIYKDDIVQWLSDNEDERKLEDLNKEEIDKITEEIVDGLDAYYYTEWY